ncbi:unnamed protein product [Anisakis simplex]|uniref:FGFR1 oncogene partner 2 homolog n=1 Tax=Anisakis simplex TaxID=6269 RepID=A0A0M3JSV7_ANISI|nr:unnamed protein product [Anisakis simplex]
MGTTNISQLMAEMRQLVVNLQSRERATEGALTKSQIVNDKISSMKEYIRWSLKSAKKLVFFKYQEEVANMNGCWRMQGRKVLLAGLQQENRQILQLQQENRELRQTLEDYEGTLEIVMQKHRMMVASWSRYINALHNNQPLPAVCNSGTDYSKQSNNSPLVEKTVQFSRMLQDRFIEGEAMSNIDQEIIARLTTENACLRELLNISMRNNPNIIREFTKQNNETILLNNSSNQSNGNIDDNSDSLNGIHDLGDDGASTPTNASHGDWVENNVKRNGVTVKKTRKILNDVLYSPVESNSATTNKSSSAAVATTTGREG